MGKQVDARGLACPQPVILTKKALEELNDREGLTTIVDNEVAKENVLKLAKSMNYSVNVREQDGYYYIDIFKGLEPEEKKHVQKEVLNGDTILMITTDVFGKGDEELGKILMKNFLYSLSEFDNLPKSVIFINTGVFLTTEGSPVLDYLKGMEDKGVEILSCGTCLDFYKLKEKLMVGKVSNMYAIVEKILSAANTIKI